MLITYIIVPIKFRTNFNDNMALLHFFFNLPIYIEIDGLTD